MSIETKFTALAAAYLSGDMKLDDEQEARISEDAQRLMTRPKQLIAPRCWINSDHFLDELQLEALLKTIRA